VLAELDRFSRAISSTTATALVRLGSRSFLDLGGGRGIPRGAQAKRHLEAQKRAYGAVIRAAAGPRPARSSERFDTQDDRPATLRNHYIP